MVHVPHGAAYSAQVPPTIFAATIALPNCANHPSTLRRPSCSTQAKAISPSCAVLCGPVLACLSSRILPPAQASTGHRSLFAWSFRVFCFPELVVGCLHWTRGFGLAWEAIRNSVLGDLLYLLYSESVTESTEY